jgi:hypothetical protein
MLALGSSAAVDAQHEGGGAADADATYPDIKAISQ